MCLQCIVDATTVLENFVPNYSLMVSNKENKNWPLGWYGIVRGNDPDLIFPMDKFLRDPCIGCDADITWDGECTFPCNTDEFHDFIDQSLRIPLRNMGFMSSVQFYEACVEAGYDIDVYGPGIEFWLMDRIARLLKNG